MQFVRVNLDDHLHICLLWLQILVLKLNGPRDPNSRLYGISDGTTPVNFPIRCDFTIRLNKGLFRPF